MRAMRMGLFLVALAVGVLAMAVPCLAGDVSFGLPTEYAVGDGPAGMEAADFNNDGVLDLAVANYGNTAGTTVSILLGVGGGSFVQGDTLEVGRAPWTMDSADVNGDGNIDLAVCVFWTGPLAIFLGAGDGTFTYFSGLPTTRSQYVAISDLDGDGSLDLVWTEMDAYGVAVARGAGDGTFTAVGRYFADSYAYALTTADFDGDGYLDAAVANQYAGVSLLFGNGDATFDAPVQYTTAGSLPASIASGDLDGDSCPDLVVGNWGENTISVLMNAGDGTFLVPVKYTAGPRVHGVALADFNGDGWLDVMAANRYGNSVSLMFGDGTGALGLPTDYATGSLPGFIVAEDFNSDGLMDFAVSNGGDGTISVFLQENSPPIITLGSDVQVDEGQTLDLRGSFSDTDDTQGWSATVDYGDSAGLQVLVLDADKTFALNHAYADNGTYTVTVQVTDDGGANGSGSIQVAVINVAPTVNAGPAVTIKRIGPVAIFLRKGFFADPGSDTWKATVDWGDGTRIQPLPLLRGKQFVLAHLFCKKGTYSVTVSVADDDGGVGSDTLVVTVK